MKILVTGSNGFVGAHLVRGIAETHPGAKVVAVDIAPAAEETTAYWSGSKGRIDTAVLDVVDRPAVLDMVSRLQPAYIVHAAAMTPSLSEERSDVGRIVDVNIGGTLAVLDAAAHVPDVRRVITISTAGVFGAGQEIAPPICENIPPAPQTLYGITKLASEGMTARLGEIHAFDTASVRLSSVYGRMERATSARRNTSFLHRLATARGPTRVSSADVTRDWVHADDVARAVAALLVNRPLQWNLYHVGGGEPVGWRRVVDIFRKHGRSIEWAERDPDIRVASDDARPVLSIARIRTQTAYAPRSIEDGIADLLRETA